MTRTDLAPTPIIALASTMPILQNEELTIQTAEGSVRIVVTRDALHTWWGADSGPQTGPELIREHLHEIEKMLVDKMLAGDIEADGTVRITSLDLETNVDDPDEGLDEVFPKKDEPDWG